MNIVEDDILCPVLWINIQVTLIVKISSDSTNFNKIEQKVTFKTAYDKVSGIVMISVSQR